MTHSPQTQAPQPPRPRSLWSLGAGEQGRITGFDGELAENYRVRLMELGFHPGEWVSCLQAPAFASPKVYRVSNTVFSLDGEVAAHIMLEPEGADELPETGGGEPGLGDELAEHGENRQLGPGETGPEPRLADKPPERRGAGQ